jgi:hypothetical protein
VWFCWFVTAGVIVRSDQFFEFKSGFSCNPKPVADAGHEILVSRPEAAGTGSVLIRRIPIKALLADSDPELNLKLVGGEEIRVPTADRIFVVGNVKKPGAFALGGDAATTVLKAVALAEGLPVDGVIGVVEVEVAGVSQVNFVIPDGVPSGNQPLFVSAGHVEGSQSGVWIAVTSISGTGFGGLPTFGNREINTIIRLRDGETNMLAGLIRDEERYALDGIPGLSDLPLVGRLFGHNTKSTTQTDIILTLTPHIIRVLDLTEADLRPFRVGRDSLAPILELPLPIVEPPKPPELPKVEENPLAPKKPGGVR